MSVKRNRFDITGNTYGKLTVIGRNMNFIEKDARHKGTHWDCICACGGLATVLKTHLLCGTTRSCGCLRRVRKKPIEVTTAARIYNSCYHSAIERNYEFNLTREYFIEHLYDECLYCGDKGYEHGYDRIDNTKGYIESNVVTCCKKCNRGKNNVSLTDFVKYLDRIQSFQEKHSDRIKKILNDRGITEGL